MSSKTDCKQSGGYNSMGHSWTNSYSRKKSFKRVKKSKGKKGKGITKRNQKNRSLSIYS